MSSCRRRSHPLRLDDFSAGDPNAESSGALGRLLLLVLLRCGRELLSVSLLLLLLPWRWWCAEPLLLLWCSSPEASSHPPSVAPSPEGHRRDAHRVGLRAWSTNLLPEGPHLLLLRGNAEARGLLLAHGSSTGSCAPEAAASGVPAPEV